MQEVVADVHGRRGHGLRLERLARPTTATAAGPCRRGSPDLDELRAAARAAARRRAKGVVALLPGGVIPNEEVFELQREVGRPITWTALLTVKGYPYHEKVVAENDAARAEGVEVWPQVSCRPLVFQMNLAEPFTLNMRPSLRRRSWTCTSTSASPPTATRRGGRRPGRSCRERAAGFPFNWPAVSVAESPSHPELADRPCSTSPRSGACTAARRRPRHLAGRRPQDPLLVGRSPTTTPTASPGSCRATTSCSAWPTPGPTCPSCATPASPPTCSATGCATARSCRSSGPSTS